jgi:hypothetical protein
VLTIGIESHDALRTLRKRVVDAGFQRGALAEIERVPDDGAAHSGRNGRSSIA